MIFDPKTRKHPQKHPFLPSRDHFWTSLYVTTKNRIKMSKKVHFFVKITHTKIAKTRK